MTDFRRRYRIYQAGQLASGFITGLSLGINRLSRERSHNKALVIYDKDFHNPRKYFDKNKIFNNNKMPARKSYGRKRTKRSSSTRGKYTSVVRGSRVSQKKSRTYKKKQPSLRKQVKTLVSKVNADQAHHTYKETTLGEVNTGVGRCEYQQEAISSVSNLDTYISQLRYYDPSVPATLVTASGATGTYHRDIHFDNIYSKLEIRNNYQVPCKVKVYLVKPKGDTNITPLTYYTNGIADQVTSAGADQQTALLYLSDIKAFKEQYSMKCVKDVILDAGAVVTCSHSTGSFTYDPSLTDSHTLGYQPKYKSCLWVMRVEGALAHDTIANQYSTTQCSIDWMVTNIAKISYDAGVSLDDIYLSEARVEAFTNAGVLTSKPVADNIGYSQA